jgi:sugar phosphate isomerase/epimerase
MGEPRHEERPRSHATTPRSSAGALRGIISFHPSLAGGDAVRWPTTVEIARESGYRAVDVWLPEIQEAPDAASERLREAGLHVGGVPLPVEFRSDAETFERDFSRLPRLAEVAAAIGATAMCRAVPATGKAPRSDLLPILRQRLTACASVLREYGLSIGLEIVSHLHTRGPAPYPLVSSLTEGAEFARSCGPNVGILLDSWHWHHADGTPEEIVEVGDLIVHVHVADAPDLPSTAIRDDERLLPGEGIIDFEGFFAAVRATRYSGVISPEVIGYACGSHRGVDCAHRALTATRAVVDAYFASPSLN